MSCPNGVTGVLHSGVSTLDGQLRRTYAPGAPLRKWVYLANLRDRNDVLFYRLLAEHISAQASSAGERDCRCQLGPLLTTGRPCRARLRAGETSPPAA
jgi:hypothetical protein